MQTFRRVMLILLWLLCTSLVAVVAARQLSDSQGDTVFDPISTIDLASRPTVELAEVSISPIVSSKGTIVNQDETWLLIAPVTPEEVAYRLLEDPVGVKARIDGGPSGFDCAWVELGPGPDGAVSAFCEIPADIAVVEGMTGTMVIQLEEPTRAQALPVTSVIGSEVTGQVIVIADGERELRTVTLGAADDLYIEITDGLEEGEQVLEFPTQIDVAEAQAT